jgi:hypothetical protein
MGNVEESGSPVLKKGKNQGGVIALVSPLKKTLKKRIVLKKSSLVNTARGSAVLAFTGNAPSL